MPKARARKKRTNSGRSVQGRRSSAQHTARLSQSGEVLTATTLSESSQKVQSARRAGAMQNMRNGSNLAMIAMVALGCWGFAFTYLFLTTDPNRYLFGGMATIMALMWSVYFGVRLRKWQQKR